LYSAIIWYPILKISRGLSLRPRAASRRAGAADVVGVLVVDREVVDGRLLVAALGGGNDDRVTPLVTQLVADG
jgi:hypothetical protein